MYKKFIGARIKEARKKARLTQLEFSELVNISCNYLSALERGTKIPKLETFIKITNALNVSSDSLLMDVIHQAREVKNSELSSKLSDLSPTQYNIVTDVIELLVSDLKKL